MTIKEIFMYIILIFLFSKVIYIVVHNKLLILKLRFIDVFSIVFLTFLIIFVTISLCLKNYFHI